MHGFSHDASLDARPHSSSWHRRLTRSLRAAGALAVLATALASPAHADQLFGSVNLVTDDQAFNKALNTDPGMVNAWGMSYLPGGPLWISANNGGVSEIDALTSSSFTEFGDITIPGDGSATGQVANLSFGSGSFNGDLFLFVNEDGTISGWRPSLGGSAETLQAGAQPNVYKGAAYDTIGGHSYLLASNFRNGTVDVLKGDAAAPALAGSFSDAAIPAGYAPFNIQVLAGHVYVTYALQNAAKHDDVKGPGHGFVDEFNLDGTFSKRIASGGDLNSPWGLAIAPTSFGKFAGHLIVGNFGDGTLHVFDVTTATEIGTIDTKGGTPLTISGLWGIIPGNNGLAGHSDSLFFSAGPNDESHGLVGLITTPEPATLAFLTAGLAGLGFAARRKKLVSAPSA